MPELQDKPFDMKNKQISCFGFTIPFHIDLINKTITNHYTKILTCLKQVNYLAGENEKIYSGIFTKHKHPLERNRHPCRGMGGMEKFYSPRKGASPSG